MYFIAFPADIYQTYLAYFVYQPLADALGLAAKGRAKSAKGLVR